MTHDGWSITLSTRSNGTHTARSQAPWIVCVLLKTIPTCSFSALDFPLGLLPSPSLPLSCAVSVSPHHTVTSSALTTTPPTTTLPAPSLPIPASVCGKKQVMIFSYSHNLPSSSETKPHTRHHHPMHRPIASLAAHLRLVERLLQRLVPHPVVRSSDPHPTLQRSRLSLLSTAYTRAHPHPHPHKLPDPRIPSREVPKLLLQVKRRVTPLSSLHPLLSALPL